MNKGSFAVSIGAMLLFVANAGAIINPKVVPMPEPSAIPELVACLGGLGYVAWRKYKGGQR